MNKYFLYILVCIAIGSCKKYPDDSKSIHLRTVKGRLAGGWIKSKKQWDAAGMFRLSNNLVVTANYLPSDNIIFRRDGFFGGAYDPYLNFGGGWDFIDKKNKLSITNNNNGVTSEYIIVKLDNDELWFQNDSLLFKFTEHVK